jgi:hypothetical protein
MAEAFKRGILIQPRRNGKDILCWNLLLCKAMQRPALYYYIAPYYNQVRQIIWEGFSGERRFLDYIPPELVANKTKLDMRIDLVNGSQIKLQGSDAIDRIVGTNPYGIVFTEFSLHKPEAWDLLRPILAENGGRALFNGTPRGLNHLYELYKSALKGDGLYDWFVQFLTRDDTGVPSLEAIEEDRRSGMPEELIQQEYYCSFMSGSVGSYYADTITRIREGGHLTRVPYEPKLPVYTGWDLGRSDATAVWFAQVIGREVRIIDYYEDINQPLQVHAKKVLEKPYLYEDHFAPFDIEVKEYTSYRSRKEKALDWGLPFTTTQKHRVEERHDAVRDFLNKCYFDQGATFEGVNALMGYQKKYDSKTRSYSETPLRNWAKHGADAFGILAMNDDNMDTDLTQSSIPKVFRTFGNSIPKVIRHLKAA